MPDYQDQSDMDDRDFDEVAPASGQQAFDASFRVKLPSQEQLVSEVSRQIIDNARYSLNKDFGDLVKEGIRRNVDEQISKLAEAAIGEILAKPMQPTDAFGNKVGEPTTLQGFICARVAAWAQEITDSNGNPTKKDAYNSAAPRIDWLLGKMVHGELKNAVDLEARKIIGTLKAGATNVIAKQIADRISGLIIKD